MGIYKIEHKRPKDSRFLNYVNFLPCILLASDSFKDNQLLSQLTHTHNRDTVPLSSSSIACLSARLGVKRLFSSANFLQIADVVRRVVFLLFLLCF